MNTTPTRDDYDPDQYRYDPDTDTIESTRNPEDVEPIYDGDGNIINGNEA